MAIQFGDSDSDGSALSRPFGVALLFAGCDPDHGSQLFHMDPSGTYVRYDAKAIGSGSEGKYIISHNCYWCQCNVVRFIVIDHWSLNGILDQYLWMSAISYTWPSMSKSAQKR